MRFMTITTAASILSVEKDKQNWNLIHKKTNRHFAELNKIQREN